MDIGRSIRRAVPLLAQYGNMDQGILLAWLIRAGMSRQEAHDAMRFVPLAFGRELLKGMGVVLSPAYINMTAGAREERALDKEPFYRAAMWLASLIAKEDAAMFSIVATQSSEVQAVNAALNGGADAAGLVASPPVIECTMPTCATLKPWWRFW